MFWQIFAFARIVLELKSIWKKSFLFSVKSSFIDRDAIEIAINECNQDGDDDG